MIEYKTRDLLAEEVDALVNTVNCVGHMGAGIALQFKKAWPENFRAYAAACRDGEVQPGRMLTYETNQLTPPRYIVNFPTKRHWRGRSRLEDIDAGLVALAEEIRRLDLKSIAVPPLGAGLGGLSWHQVRPRIERALGALPELRVVVFEPHGTPEEARAVLAAKPDTRGNGSSVSAPLLKDSSRRSDWSCSRLCTGSRRETEFHRITRLLPRCTSGASASVAFVPTKLLLHAVCLPSMDGSNAQRDARMFHLMTK